jgi:cytochrome c oxidase cbb3-type subunit 3
MRFLIHAMLIGGLVVRAAAQGNPEAAKLQNPVTASAEAIAAGKQSYNRYCANCHGLDAHGSLGNDLTGPAPDLTVKNLKHGSTDGEMFTTIKNGIAPDFNMGPWKDQLSDDDIWKVVLYIHSRAK